jgi:formyltetrahydrofolate deformylase
MKNYVLKISCKDKPGIVSMLTIGVSECDGNITDLDQYTDKQSGRFFLRMVFSFKEEKLKLLEDIIESIKTVYSMKVIFREEAAIKRALILCSKQPHCLIHLLEKIRQGAIGIDVPAIISNHDSCNKIASYHNIPFHHLPITAETKKEQEAKIQKIIDNNNIDYIILARYMQILSPEFCAKYKGRIINIHHSFLPGFKGANPYKQAHERGVKIIGATAHFVTADLDEGPIITQKTIRVNHHHSIDELTRFGADIESLVLSSAVKYVANDQVFIDGKKTIVFK